MNTKIVMIAGGVGAVGLVGFLFLRSRMAASESEEQSAPVSADLSTMLYGPPAISGGISSGDQGGLAGMGMGGGFSLPGMTDGSGMGINLGGTAPTAASLDQMLAGYFTNANLQNTAKIQSSIYTNDTNALVELSYGSFGGSSSVSHDKDGTTSLTVKQNQDPNFIDYGAFLDGIYESVLGRKADASGKAYYLDAIRKGNNLNDVYNALQGSDEYKKKNGTYVAPASGPGKTQAQINSEVDEYITAQRKIAYTDPTNNYYKETSSTDINTGITTVTATKSSA